VFLPVLRFLEQIVLPNCFLVVWSRPMASNSLSLEQLAANSNVLAGRELEIVHQILEGPPGLLPVTGQPGTGKTTTLFVIAYHLWKHGVPVAVFTEDQDLLENMQFPLPSEWEFQWVSPNEKEWIEAVQPKLNNPAIAVVTDMITGNNDAAIINAAEQGHWVLTCIDTPFVGPDVLYNLRGNGLPIHRALQLLSGITSQILLSKLCSACSQLEEGTLEETQLVYSDSLKPRQLWREQGCPECEERGTKGRCAAYEILKVDEETKPLLESYLEHNVIKSLPPNKHLTMRESSKFLVSEGLVGIATFRREVLQNPLLRLQHYWEQESLRAARIQDMFGRFVTQQLVTRLMSQQDFQHILEGERRQIACLFCDVRGFTSLAEQSTPAQVFLTLNRYFREIINTVFQFEGMIDKFIGDSVMVVFGTPIEQLDRELRAVQCAIAIQRKVAQINQVSDASPIDMGIGINSGEVMAGCLGSDLRMDYTVIGDVVNIAARLESQAKPGQILIGAATYRAVRHQVSCQSVGALPLRGKAETVEAFAVHYQT
jgi:class 3 adenylate cyclase